MVLVNIYWSSGNSKYGTSKYGTSKYTLELSGNSKYGTSKYTLELSDNSKYVLWSSDFSSSMDVIIIFDSD
jgi:hypothetical protein